MHKIELTPAKRAPSGMLTVPPASFAGEEPPDLSKDFSAASRRLKIGYTQYGHGPEKILFIHGFATSRAGWAFQQFLFRDSPELQERFTAVFMDNRGVGESTQPPGLLPALKNSTDLMALDAIRLVHFLGWVDDIRDRGQLEAEQRDLEVEAEEAENYRTSDAKEADDEAKVELLHKAQLLPDVNADDEAEEEPDDELATHQDFQEIKEHDLSQLPPDPDDSDPNRRGTWAPPMAKKRFHLVGISMGGMISLRIAAMWPHLLKSLSLFNTHAGGLRAGLNTFKGTLVMVYWTILRLLPVKFKSRQDAALMLLYGDSDRKTPWHWEAIKEANAARIRMTSRQSIWGMVSHAAAVVKHNVSWGELAMLRRLAVTPPSRGGLPTSIFVGTRDLVVHPTNSFQLRSWLDAQLHIFQGKGHGVIGEVPVLINSILLRHIARAAAGKGYRCPAKIFHRRTELTRRANALYVQRERELHPMWWWTKRLAKPAFKALVVLYLLTAARRWYLKRQNWVNMRSGRVRDQNYRWMRLGKSLTLFIEVRRVLGALLWPILDSFRGT